MGEWLKVIGMGLWVIIAFIISLIAMWWSLCLMLFSLSFGIELFFNHGLIDALFKCWELGKTIPNSM